MTILYGIYLIANFMQALYPRQKHCNILNIQALQDQEYFMFDDSLQRFSAGTETRTHSRNRKSFVIAP
jgi:hypothetical protein